MATNPYFDNFTNSPEQTLIEDLIIESIKMYGHDVYYCPRTIVSRDNVLNEDALSEYNSSYQIEMYIKNVEGFEGEGDFLSKFGLQIRDQVTFSIANRTFERYVTREVETLIRPREGDLIYFPLNEKMFEIKFTEHESVFYQSGALQVYDVRCELIEYTGQRFATGYENIDNYFDSIDTTQTTTLQALANTEADGSDALARNYTFETEGDNILDFSESDPFTENINISDT